MADLYSNQGSLPQAPVFLNTILFCSFPNSILAKYYVQVKKKSMMTVISFLGAGFENLDIHRGILF